MENKKCICRHPQRERRVMIVVVLLNKASLLKNTFDYIDTRSTDKNCIFMSVKIYSLMIKYTKGNKGQNPF